MALVDWITDIRKRNPGTDAEIRKLERLAQQGDPDAIAKLQYRRDREAVQLEPYVPMSGKEAYWVRKDNLKIGAVAQDTEGWFALHEGQYSRGPSVPSLDAAVDMVLEADRRDPVAARPECTQCNSRVRSVNDAGLCSFCESENEESPPGECSACGGDEETVGPLNNLGLCEWCNLDENGRPFGTCPNCGGARARDKSCACRPRRRRNPLVGSVSDRIRFLMKEGYPHKQAIAIALSSKKK